MEMLLKVLRSSSDLYGYDSKFQRKGALTPKAFAANSYVSHSSENFKRSSCPRG